MFTKAITKGEVWDQLLDLAQIRRPASSFSSSPSGGPLGAPPAGVPGDKKKNKGSTPKNSKSSESKRSSSSSSTGKEKKPQSRKSRPIAVACLAVSKLAGCGLVLDRGRVPEQSVLRRGYQKQEPSGSGGVDVVLPSDTYACDVSSSQAPADLFAPNNALYRVDVKKFFEALDMEEDDNVAQPSAIEAASERWAALLMQARGDLDAAVPAGGPLGAPPVGIAATGHGQAPTTRTWGEEIPPPPQPPLPPDLPTKQEAMEEIGINEPNLGRETDQRYSRK